MGLLNTVVKKAEGKLPISAELSGEERKLLMNINARIDDLKNQNMENAKFLRGIGKKIENELDLMREAEENKSIEVKDDAGILQSLERVEQAVQELDNNEILTAIDRVNASISDINTLGMMSELDKISKSMGETNSDDVVLEVRKINDSVKNINFDDILVELEKINETMKNVNTDIVLIEIDKINRALKEVNSASVLEEVSKIDAKLDEIKTADVLDEVRRVEAIVSDINENAVLAEIEKLKSLIAENSGEAAIGKVSDKIDSLKSVDYTDRLDELEAAIKKNDTRIDELIKKVDRVATMPTMIKSVIETNNSENLTKIEEIITELNEVERKKNDSMRMIVNVNLWVSILTIAVLVANILGII